MAEEKDIVNAIVEGIQDKKGKRITVVDLTKLQDAPCEYFVICEGDSNTQVNAIADSVKDVVRERVGEKPVAVDGLDNCVWVAMDYMQIIVHIFMRDTRTFYDIEHLWSDANLTDIPDMD